ncbi:Eco57I restriction-modification methylase domain-containing protein [[Phormidium] sp. ETS-05]|uniref:Eco57I restriction-modification methylase domain-containing protein n=1 Tax=[Phormidium] sp. ETS-05 TaxID=222819 RepID=UPI0018EEE271|nr:Eco57I restriction-modification methylase domain-containing protein [[Phormidium] sp. ETS-05]
MAKPGGSKNPSEADAAVITATQKLSEENRFFHWDLEFPEVFIDLETAGWDENGGFDAVVGNPPYDVLAERERQENLDGLNKYLKSNQVFAPSLGGKPNLFRLFMSRSDYLLSSLGSCGMIIPMSFLGDKQAVGLRKFFLERQKIRQVNAFPQKDDPNRRIFPEAKLPTCIVIFSNDAQTDKITVKVHPGNRLEEISGEFECSLTEIQALDEENLPIPLLSSGESKVLQLLADRKRLQRLENICQTYQGEINETNMADLISTEPGSGEKIWRGGNVQRYELIPEPKQGVTKYLNVAAYSGKVGGDRATHTQLTRICYQRNAALDSYKRLIFAILPTPCYCFDSISYFLINDKNQAFALMALLNYRLLEWRFRLTSSNNHVSTSEIAALPVPKFNFTTPQPQRQQSLASAINLYHEYQKNGDFDVILSQVRHHLSQQPEESDVIHDLLAYLAEQMTDLNQHKQAEIQGFLQWLESFIGSPIDNLTNKSKIQNYLGDYYKDEHSLSLAELTAILKKNEKKLKLT